MSKRLGSKKIVEKFVADHPGSYTVSVNLSETRELSRGEYSKYFPPIYIAVNGKISILKKHDV